VARVSGNPEYRAAFSEEFGATSITTAQIRTALTAYVAALNTGTSAYDRWMAGETAAMSAPAQRGLTIFTNAGGCAECHRLDASPATFTDDRYHDVGIGLGRIAPNLRKLAIRVENTSAPQLEELIAADPDIAELGRYLVTRDPKDIGKYRTPSLRNVAVTAPYFHDGSVKSLEEAVGQELYYRAQERGRALALNTQEQADLVEFLRALTDAPYERYFDSAASPTSQSKAIDSIATKASPVAADSVAKGK
jgi:cytochrome c peroxidase